MNTNQQIPEFTQVKRVNKKQIFSAIMYGILVVVVPVAGFMGAMRYDQKRSADKPQVLGAQVSTVKTNSSKSDKLPIIGSFKMPSFLGASQLLIGFGALMGLVSIAVAFSLLREEQTPKEEAAIDSPPVEATVVQ